MIYTTLDVETCGFHGVPVILQYSFDGGPIQIHEFWRVPVKESLTLIEKICQTAVVGFNLAFDWFHICKSYTIFSLCPFDWIPGEHIEEIALLEPEARFGPCVKPKSALDIMLIARRGRYQSLMKRKPITIRKVPDVIAWKLAEYLEQTIHLDDIYFSRRKDRFAPRWAVKPTKDKPGFQDISLNFKPSGALKVLAEHALKIPKSEILLHDDAGVDKAFTPTEKGWAPFALAVGKPGKWNRAWPEMIQFHIDHWAFNDRARQYATADVDYTWRLREFFGNPLAGDVDSILTCMVAAVRWRSFATSKERIAAEKKLIREEIKSVPLAPHVAKIYITEVMEPVEAQQVKGTDRKTLEALAKMKCDCQFDSEIKCSCEGSGLHPAALRAAEVLTARQGQRRDGIYKKLEEAGRFHASFKVGGTLSNRMSGDDDLNAMGFERQQAMRACFILADKGFSLCGGDFDSFEVVIGAAVYNDPALTKQLTTQVPCTECDGPDPQCDDCLGTGKTTQKLHALFGMELSGLTYDEVMATKGNKDRDWYNTGKAGILSQFYGGDYGTLVRKQGIEEEIAKSADENFVRKYPGVARDRRTIIDMFCSMRQPGGIGTKVEWHEPSEKIESLLGFPRYFTLENSICKALFDLANNIPKDWKSIKGRVVRTDRKQTAAGATASALYGAAFGIQGNSMRAGANHRIQSTGAEITKKLEVNIYEVQPCGVHPWRVIPMNGHDEVMAPVLPEYVEEVKKIADETVESYRKLIPLIKMNWKTGLADWSKK